MSVVRTERYDMDKEVTPELFQYKVSYKYCGSFRLRYFNDEKTLNGFITRLKKQKAIILRVWKYGLIDNAQAPSPKKIYIVMLKQHPNETSVEGVFKTRAEAAAMCYKWKEDRDKEAEANYRMPGLNQKCTVIEDKNGFVGYQQDWRSMTIDEVEIK